MKSIKNYVDDKKFVNEVKKLMTKECLSAREISELKCCSIKTIQRIKKKYNIENRNMQNRKDKKFICLYCGNTAYIKRHEISRLLCPDCRMKHKDLTKRGGD